MKTGNRMYQLFAGGLVILVLAACSGAVEPAPRDTSPPVESAGEGSRVEKEFVGETHQPTPPPMPTATYGAAGEAEEPGPGRTSGYEPVTAGVVDDNEQWNGYLNYLANNRHIWANHRDVSERYLIKVQDHNKQVVHDAVVQVYAGDTLVFSGRTDAGGLLRFHPRAAANDMQTGGFQVHVRKGQALTAANFQRYTQEDWMVTLLDAPIAGQNQLDLLFLMDATGSMSDEIDKLKATMGDIADQIDALPERPNVRYGLAAYRDRGDRFIVRLSDFTQNLAAFQRELGALEASGGGDYPESVNEALHRSLHELSWRENDAVRMVILVADAPPHLDYGEPYSYDTDMIAAVGLGVKLFPIGASGLDDQGEFIFRQMAQFTGGKFVFLTYAEAGDPGSGPGSETSHDVTNYSVDTLDRLVVRLVTEELAKLPDSSLAQTGPSYTQPGHVQVSQGNPGFDPDNPVWAVGRFFPGSSPSTWYLNGDFANGLENWQAGHGSNINDLWSTDVVARVDDRGSVLDFWRENALQDGGVVWLEQPLAMDVSKVSRLQVKADLKLVSHTLENSGWWCDANNCEGEYPLRLSIYYTAADGATYLWAWGFLTRPNTAQLRNYDIVPQGEWYAFESPNLLDLYPRPVMIQAVQIAGAGWDFHVQVDEVELAVGK